MVVVLLAGAAVYYTLGNTSSGMTNTTTTTTLTSTTSPPSNVLLNGGGSTLVYPLMSEWTFTYNQLHPNVQIGYAAVGSGSGIKEITGKLLDFGGTDAPLTASQYAALPSGTTLLTIPESDSGVVPAYNVPGVTVSLKFTGAVLAQIFLGAINMWNDPALVALNPSLASVNHPIVVVHRSDGSGTMYAFTNFLSDASPQWKTQVGESTSVAWPVGLGCLHNAGVAQCISSNQYSIGPLEIAYEITNSGTISYGSVQNAAGNFVLANLTNIAATVQIGGTTGLPAGNASWSKVSIIDNIYNDTKDANIYPITTFTYIVIYQQQTDPVKATALVDFIWWIVNSGQSAGSSLGYPPLPANVVALDDATLNSVTFNGTPVHSGTM